MRQLWRRAVAVLAACTILFSSSFLHAAVIVYGGTARDYGYVNLTTLQTGNGDSQNIVDRGTLRRAGLLTITTVVGATPTVTINIQGSVDGVTWFNIAYAAQSVPETVSVVALVITTATTSSLILRAEHPWRFMKIVLSANTNVTVTADVAA